MNLSDLHQRVSLLFPIDGISIDDNNQYIFHSELPIPEDKLSEIYAVIDEWKLDSEKKLKKQILDINWSNRLKSGWTTSFGWNLGLDTQDVSLLTGAFLLAKEASANGIDAPASIVDVNGQSHSLSLSDFTSLMLMYGQARSELSNLYASKLNSINSATNIEDVQLVDVSI